MAPEDSFQAVAVFPVACRLAAESELKANPSVVLTMVAPDFRGLGRRFRRFSAGLGLSEGRNWAILRCAHCKSERAFWQKGRT